jgi:hypothetical protein
MSTSAPTVDQYYSVAAALGSVPVRMGKLAVSKGKELEEEDWGRKNR